MENEVKKPIPVSSKEKLNQYEEEYFSHLDKMVKSDKNFSLLYEAFKAGKSKYSGIARRENKTYSPDFIIEIERAIGSLEAIVTDPHKFIKEIPSVVEVEKAKRITHHSIKHMAQHTENISSVASDGTVDPKRVLNMFIDDELQIYENRFIMTLIRRLQTFIELRHKYILEHSDTRNSDVVTMKSEVKIGDVTYEVESKLKVVVPSEDEGNRAVNEDLLNRLLTLRKRTLFLTTSRFMREMVKAAPVTDPVLQTNIMRLNYDYQAAYRLWTFISRYEQLGIEYKFEEKKVDFDEDYLKLMNYHALTSYLTISSDHKALLEKDAKLYYYKPKFEKINLDFDMTDERLLGKDNPFKVINKKETEAQIAAKLRRQQLAEEKKKKKLEEKLKEKERKAKAKEEAKKLAIQKALEKKKKEEERKAKEAEKKRLKTLEEQERKRIEKLKKEEQKKLEKARQEVARIAELRRKAK